MQTNTQSPDQWEMLSKPVYGIIELMEMFGSRTKIWRLQKQGFLKNLPGQTRIQVPRTEVIRYLESAGE